MKEEAMVFPRRDDGPLRVVGKIDPHDHGQKFIKVKVFTGQRKALRCR